VSEEAVVPISSSKDVWNEDVAKQCHQSDCWSMSKRFGPMDQKGQSFLGSQGTQDLNLDGVMSRETKQVI